MRARLLATIMVLAACGPQAEGPTDDGTPTTSTDGPASGSGEPSTGAASTGEPTTAADASTAGSTDDTAGDLLVPPEQVITSVVCLEDGRVSLLFEIFLDGGVEGCLPVPDVEIDRLLMVGINDWDGMGGTFEVGPGQPAQAQYGIGEVEVTGTFTLELSEPFSPSFMTIDLAAGATMLQGDLDLETCPSHFEGTCEPSDT